MPARFADGAIVGINGPRQINFFLLVGRFKRAHELLDKMRRNDPINQAFLAWYYYIYGFLGDRHQAKEEYKDINKLLLKGYSDWHNDVITLVRIYSGDVLSRNEIVYSDPIHITLKEYLDSPKKGLVELRRIYSSDDNLSNINLARISNWAAYFGDAEFAMEVMEKAVSLQPGNLYLYWAPLFHEIL